MRALKAAVVLMGVLIVVGTTTLIVLLVTRVGSTTAPADTVLDEPAGTRIAAASVGPDKLSVQLQGGGPDRVIIVDLRSGRRIGKVGLAR